MLSKEKIAELVKEFGKDEKDTGCTAVQIAILTNRITALTNHLKEHKHDYACRRGLFILVGKRRSLLDYLIKEDREAYVKLIAALKIRK